MICASPGHNRAPKRRWAVGWTTVSDLRCGPLEDAISQLPSRWLRAWRHGQRQALCRPAFNNGSSLNYRLWTWTTGCSAASSRGRSGPSTPTDSGALGCRLCHRRRCSVTLLRGTNASPSTTTFWFDSCSAVCGRSRGGCHSCTLRCLTAKLCRPIVTILLLCLRWRRLVACFFLFDCDRSGDGGGIFGSGFHRQSCRRHSIIVPNSRSSATTT
eukprot:COSAG05_NODE_8003_length_747_cov_0.794753_2_plen_213_part_01